MNGLPKMPKRSAGLPGFVASTNQPVNVSMLPSSARFGVFSR